MPPYGFMDPSTAMSMAAPAPFAVSALRKIVCGIERCLPCLVRCAVRRGRTYTHNEILHHIWVARNVFLMAHFRKHSGVVGKRPTLSILSSGFRMLWWCFRPSFLLSHLALPAFQV